MPSANALRPNTKKGTSAPRDNARRCNCTRGRFSLQSRLSASNTQAASELPPPSPAPMGTRLSMPISTPKGQRDCVCSSGAPDDGIVTHPEMQRIAIIQQLEDRLKGVITVGPAACNMQKQVQFCRRQAG